MKKIKIICSNKTGVEGSAIEQLKHNLNLEGMIAAYGMPDIHPGKGHPIGASFLSKDIIYPYLIGNDIGCGMSFFKLDINKLKQDKTVKKIKSLEIPLADEEISTIFKEENLHEIFSSSIGTVGGGNHFCEFQTVYKILNNDLFEKYSFDKKAFYLLVHSGSRGLGEYILQNHIKKYNSKGLTIDNPDFQTYLDNHNYALKWASLNRKVIAQRLASQLNFNLELFQDIEHNFIEKIDESTFLHRKGSIPSNRGPVVIPGSRGHHSYLVLPKNKEIYDSLFSLSHGAGRKWMRSEVKKRLSHKFKVSDLQKTSLGSRVICEDKALLYEEAPMAYKNIASVIDDLIEADLIEVIAIMKPFITYKRKRCCD